jgi:hypothetical protein
VWEDGEEGEEEENVLPTLPTPPTPSCKKFGRGKMAVGKRFEPKLTPLALTLLPQGVRQKSKGLYFGILSLLKWDEYLRRAVLG